LATGTLVTPKVLPATAAEKHFPGRADGNNGNFFPVSLPANGGHLVGALAGQVAGVEKFRPGGSDFNTVPAASLRLAFQNHRLYAKACQFLGGYSAGVGLLDAAGERALAAYRKPARGGCVGSRKQAGRNCKLVKRAKGVAGRRYFIVIS
jgi:hypothetical protein